MNRQMNECMNKLYNNKTHSTVNNSCYDNTEEQNTISHLLPQIFKLNDLDTLLTTILLLTLNDT